MNMEQPEKPDFCFRKRRRGHKCRRVQSAMRIRDVGVLGGRKFLVEQPAVRGLFG
jgi:hypothetical protein